MQLNQKILIIYPELEGLTNPFSANNPYLLQDDSDGNGPYIKIWNYSKPQPTQEQLDNIE